MLVRGGGGGGKEASQVVPEQSTSTNTVYQSHHRFCRIIKFSTNAKKLTLGVFLLWNIAFPRSSPLSECLHSSASLCAHTCDSARAASSH